MVALRSPCWAGRRWRASCARRVIQVKHVRLRAGRAGAGRRAQPASSAGTSCPTSSAPVIVVATITLGGFIGAEATLSFLGIGLQPPAISWGIQISRRPAVLPDRPAHAALPGGLPVADRAGLHHARRRRPRRPRPEAPLTRARNRRVTLIEHRTGRGRRRRPDRCCSRSRTCTWSSAPVTASRGRSTACPSRSRRARRWPSSASRAPGKSVTAQAIMGILDSPPGWSPGGQVLLPRRRPAHAARRRSAGTYRGEKIAMIFQDALSCAEPGLHRRLQIGEMFRVHRGHEQEGRQGARPSS